jgi:hypothetical protein
MELGWMIGYGALLLDFMDVGFVSADRMQPIMILYPFENHIGALKSMRIDCSLFSAASQTSAPDWSMMVKRFIDVH